MNITQTKQALKVLEKAGVTPLLIGHKGTGKTELVNQYAKENGFDSVITIRLGQADGTGDLIGLADFATKENGDKVTKFIVPDILSSKGNYILFLDEINRASKDLLQAIFELVYDRRMSINGFKLPTNCMIVAAMNPATENYDVLDFQDEAFSDRFCHIKVENTVGEWLSYARTIGVSPTITGFISDQPELLRSKLCDFSLKVSPSERSYVVLDKVEKSYDLDDDSILKELAMGIIGLESSIAYFKYKEENCLRIESSQIVNDYSTVSEVIKKYASNETNRSDILKSVLDDLGKYLGTLDQLNKEQENNVVNFFIDLPIDLLKGNLMCMHVKALNMTDGVAGGLCENKKLIKHIESFIVKKE